MDVRLVEDRHQHARLALQREGQPEHCHEIRRAQPALELTGPRLREPAPLGELDLRQPALFPQLAHVLAEQIPCAFLRLRILAEDGSESVDEFVMRTFEALADIHREQLEPHVRGLSAAIAWPQEPSSSQPSDTN